MLNFIKKAFNFDEQETKAFKNKLQETIDRAERIKREALGYGWPKRDARNIANTMLCLTTRDAIKIADEMLCLIDDLNELSKIRDKEIHRCLRQQLYTAPYPGLF